MQYVISFYTCINAKLNFSQIACEVSSYIKICIIVSHLRLRNEDYVIIRAYLTEWEAPDEEMFDPFMSVHQNIEPDIFPFDPTQHCY